MANVALFHPGDVVSIVVPQPPLPPVGDCWQFWDAPSIANCTNSPLASVQSNWPALYAELVKRNIGSREVCAACLGTLAVETAHTFEPVQEAFWLDDAWRYANLRYAPYWGRGYVQLTWDYNYTSYGNQLGVDLINNPDWAMHPEIAAAVMAEYFLTAGVAESAQACDWPEVRRKVQGAHAGLDELLNVVHCLGMP